jgi:serine/threonine-protein kinase
MTDRRKDTKKEKAGASKASSGQTGALRAWGRRGWWVLKFGVLSLAGLLVGLVIFDRVIMPLVVRHGDEVEVPSVLLMDEATADTLLKGHDLGLLVVATRDDPEVPYGRIMDQAPGPGMRVKTGRTVRVLVSSGVKGRLVPELRGQPVSHARILLSREGIRMGKITYVASHELPDHRVLAAHPAPGAPVGEGEAVHLLVSRGKPERAYLMPDLRGQFASRVRNRLEGAGLRVEVRPWPGEPRETNFIVEQTPPPGHRVAQGATVELLTGRP